MPASHSSELGRLKLRGAEGPIKAVSSLLWAPQNAPSQHPFRLTAPACPRPPLSLAAAQPPREPREGRRAHSQMWRCWQRRTTPPSEASVTPNLLKRPGWLGTGGRDHPLWGAPCTPVSVAGWTP